MEIKSSRISNVNANVSLKNITDNSWSVSGSVAGEVIKGTYTKLAPDNFTFVGDVAGKSISLNMESLADDSGAMLLHYQEAGEIPPGLYQLYWKTQ